jgi:hypothetical protein
MDNAELVTLSLTVGPGSHFSADGGGYGGGSGPGAGVASYYKPSGAGHGVG